MSIFQFDEGDVSEREFFVDDIQCICEVFCVIVDVVNKLFFEDEEDDEEFEEEEEEENE